MQLPARLATLLVLLVPLSGCTGDEDVIDLETPTLPNVAIDAETGEELFLKSNLTVGRWWTVHLAVDYGNGFIQDIEGKIVVTEAGPAGYRLESDVEAFGIFDSYFDSFYHGRFDADLNPILKENQTWTTELPAQGFGTFSGDVDEVAFAVTRFGDEHPQLGPRLRILGRTPANETLDYDYAPATGWMTYFRMINQTTGRVVVSLDFRETGTDHAGPVHHITQETRFLDFAMTPPFDPSFAPVPPAERFTVPPGYAWVEEIQFLFTFPLGPSEDQPVFGGGEVAVVITRPEGPPETTTHTGAGDVFTVKFERNVVGQGFTGDWSVSIVPAATGGAFVGVYGMLDEVVEL